MTFDLSKRLGRIILHLVSFLSVAQIDMNPENWKG